MILAPSSAAYLEVPHPVRTILRTSMSFSLLVSRPPSTILRPSIRAPYASARAMASGCSSASLMVKCANGAGDSRISWSGACSIRLMSIVCESVEMTPSSPS